MARQPRRVGAVGCVGGDAVTTAATVLLLVAVACGSLGIGLWLLGWMDRRYEWFREGRLPWEREGGDGV